MDVVTLAAMLGHSKLALITRYAHPTQKHQMSAMEKLAAHNSAKEEKEIAQEKVAASRLKIVKTA